MLVWHYTTPGAWVGINESGEIRPSHYNLCWFSTDPTWEQSLNEQRERWLDGKKPIRIAVEEEVAPIRFVDSVPPETVASFRTLGLLDYLHSQLTMERDLLFWQSGRTRPYPHLAPNLWQWVGYGSQNFRVREGPCPRELWKAVEVWNGKAWVALNEAELTREGQR